MVVKGNAEDRGVIFVFSCGLWSPCSNTVGTKLLVVSTWLWLSCSSVPLCFAILVHQVISRNLLFEFVILFLASSIFASFRREYGVSPATWAHAPS